MSLGRIHELPWRKILRWLALVLLLLAFSGMLWIEWGRYNWVRKQHRTYGDVTLGMERNEVLYRMGTPDAVTDNVPIEQNIYPVYFTDSHDPVNVMPKGKTISDYNEWAYTRDPARYDIDLDPKSHRVTVSACFDNADKPRCPSLYGVSAGQSEEDVIARLGTPSKQDLKEGTKTLTWDDLGVVLYLKKSQVYFIKKVEPKSSAWDAFWRHFLF